MDQSIHFVRDNSQKIDVERNVIGVNSDDLISHHLSRSIHIATANLNLVPTKRRKNGQNCMRLCTKFFLPTQPIHHSTSQQTFFCVIVVSMYGWLSAPHPKASSTIALIRTCVGSPSFAFLLLYQYTYAVAKCHLFNPQLAFPSLCL